MGTMYVEAAAIISECGLYRYDLRRVWDRSKPLCLWVMLNPSTADGTRDDPTIRRCVGFADRWGHGGIVVVNLFAFRATDPKKLKDAANPIGPENWSHIHDWATRCKTRVAAWGAWGEFMGRGAEILRDLSACGLDLLHLGLTKDNHPRHPLYVAGSTEPVPFTVSA